MENKEFAKHLFSAGTSPHFDAVKVTPESNFWVVEFDNFAPNNTFLTSPSPVEG